MMKYTIISETKLQSLLNEQRSELSGYDFSEINFVGTDLKSSIFIDCKFTNCNLSNVSILNVVMRGVIFENCNLMGVNWTEARKGADIRLNSCKLDYGCFQDVDLRGVSFENSSIREADFSGANLCKANLNGCQLSGTSFVNSNLEKADFRNARGYYIDPKFAKIKEAKFSFPEVLCLIHALGAEVEM